MLKSVPASGGLCASSGLWIGLWVAIAATGVAGCAKSNPDGPTWSLTGSRGAAPLPPEPISPRPEYKGGRDAQTGLARAPGPQPITAIQPARHAAVEIAPLPPIAGQAANTKPAAAPAARPGRTADGRTIIDVQTGDTLTSISAAHHVSVAALMFANNLRSPAVQPGMRLVLPTR
jgi:LysM repeat protein